MAALVPGFVQGARAEPAPGLIPRRLFWAAPDRAQVTISPDGSKIAFLAPVDGVQNVWVAPLSNPTAGKPVTRIDDRDVLNQLWWPGDNEHVIFCRERAGEEDWQTHCVDIETGTVRALSPGPGVTSVVHQVSARFPGELLIAHNQRDKAYFDIYRVQVATAQSTLVFQNTSFAGLFTDSHFNVRFGIRYREGGGWDVVKAAGDGVGSVFRSVALADRYTTALVGASDDGKQLYWLDSKGRDSAAVVSQETSDGALRTLLENRSADFSEPTFDPVRRTPIAAPLVYTKRRWYTLDPGASPDLDRMQASTAT